VYYDTSMGRKKESAHHKCIDGVVCKSCCGCKNWLPLEEFYPKKSGGYVPRCKKCVHLDYVKNTPRLKEYYRKKWERLGTSYNQDYYNNNKDQHRQRQRRYLDKPETKAKQRERYRSNSQLRIARTLRIRVRGLIRGIRATKTESTYELLGCSLEQFTAHLESLFRPGMSWANYGKHRTGEPPTWHIDHIRPCASFDLTDPEQQKQCFHYTNLQPLWASENMSKGDSLC
jgi:hypothetical protein